MVNMNLLVFVCLLGLPYLISSFCLEATAQNVDNSSLNSVDFSPNTSLLIHTSDTGNLVIRDGKNLNILSSIPMGSKANCARFSHNGSLIAIGTDSNTVTFLNSISPWGSNTTLNTGHGKVFQLSWNHNDTRMITCGQDGKVKIWDMTTFTQIGSSIIEAGVDSCKYSTVDNGFAYGGTNNFMRYVPNGAASASINKDTGDDLYCMDFSPDGTKIINGGKKKRQYTTVIANNDLTFQYEIDEIYDCAYSPDNKYYAYVGKADTAAVYSTTTSLRSTYSDGSFDLKSVTFSKEGSYMAVGNSNGGLFLYSVNCISCLSGWYYNSTTVACAQCSSTIVGCGNCFNSTTCHDCIQGYFLNSTTMLCRSCNIMQGCGGCQNSTVCTQCIPGYYVNSTFGCKTCESAQPGCLVCNSSSKCLQCQIDYYLTSGGSCTSCTSLNRCLRCNTSSNCFQCQMGFYSNSGTCTACPTNCMTCSSNTNCTSCAIGFFVTTTNTCQACTTDCISCNSSTYCMDCIQKYYSNAGVCTLCSYPCDTCNSSTYCQSCVIGYFDHHNGTCEICSQGCLSCNTSVNCDSCMLSYYLRADQTCQHCSLIAARCEKCNSTNCLRCNIGYYVSTGSCVSCNTNMYGCISCNSSTNCYTCTPGTYHTGGIANASCAQCGQGCSTCSVSATICQSCLPGFYYNANACSRCINNCATCTTNTHCLSCVIGYFIDGTVCQQCSVNITNCIDCYNQTYCITCGVGYYPTSSNSVCTACTSPCITCTGATSCLSCQIGYYLVGTTCIACSANCSQCVSASNCTSCIPGFYHVSATTSCSHCSTINCLQCDATNCFSCKTGYYVDGTSNCSSCITAIDNCLDCDSSATCLKCNYGYILNTGSTGCDSCASISGCMHCTSASVCEICQPGFYLLANNLCQICTNGCSTCNSTDCFTCSPGYVLNTGSTPYACDKCQLLIQGCLLCTDASTCVDCLNGYYLSGGTCSLCRSSIKGCSFCNDSSTCVHCQDGFYLDVSNNDCNQCSDIQGCQVCNSSTVCLDCQSGYYLVPGSICNLCSSTIIGCISCSDSLNCVDCKTGFYLDASNDCILCSTLIGCSLCTDANNCLQCRGGFYLSAASHLCVPCSQKGCQICQQSSPLDCVTCNSRYFMNGTTCSRCANAIEGCVECSVNNICTQCDTGYFIDSSNQCSLCSSVLDGCGKCSSSTTCIQCKSNYFMNGSICSACSQAINGCSFCTDSTNCLSCSSGYFTNGTGCASCMSITGCLVCSDSTTCLFCTAAYYLNGAVCSNCSVLEGCYSCISATQCTSCLGGYVLDSGACSVMKVAAAAQVTNLLLKTFYINENTLKHILYTKDYDYTQATLNLSQQTTLTLVSKHGDQIILTITSTEWISKRELAFYTNNPLNLTTNDMKFARLLTVGSLPGDYKVNFGMTQNGMDAILPNYPNSGDMSLDYELDSPQFYGSFTKTIGYGYYYIFGIFITVFCLVHYFIKAVITVPSSEDKGQIISHIFAMKCGALILYPTYIEYISYCWGFMTADMPWLNDLLGPILGQISDVSPYPYLMYYTNLNLGSTYLLAIVGIFTIFLIASVIFLSLKNKQRQFANFREFMYNFFIFGAAVASSVSIQGAVLNPIDTVSVNALFYILGLILCAVILGQCIYSVYRDYMKIWKIRIFMKAAFLSAAHQSPVYIVAAAIFTDLVLIFVEFFLNRKVKYFPHVWIIPHIICDIALTLLIFIPWALIGLILVSGLIVVALLIEFTMHIMQILHEQKKGIKLQQKIIKTPNEKIELDPQQFDNNLWNIEFNKKKNSTDKSNLNETLSTMKSTKYEPIRRKNKKNIKAPKVSLQSLKIHEFKYGNNTVDDFVIKDVNQ